MTSTASLKDKFKQGFSFFQWELKSCAGTLTIFSILTALFIVINFITMLVFSIQADKSYGMQNMTDSTFNTPNIFLILGLDNINKPSDISKLTFQLGSFNTIFVMTIIFTVIYTIKVFGYLHNKRQTDMYGAMPISRTTLFFSKSATAFIFSVAPALIFMGIVSLVSLIWGMPLAGAVSKMFVNIIIGSLACISAYGFLAICCGTGVNAVIMFIAVCVCYPIATYMIKAMLESFFYGINLGFLNDSFIMNGLSPVCAYSGKNIIYWLVFTVGCLTASAYLIKRRKAERAQSSFAYYLPCHILKVLISFIVGMLLGLLFGAMNVLDNGYWGFVLGFILASVPTFIICHLIFYHGFRELIKTSLILDGLVVVTIVAIAVVNFNPLGIGTYVPKAEDIESAGFINSSTVYYKSPDDSFDKLLAQSYADTTDEKDIDNILKLHSYIVEGTSTKSQEKFRRTWIYIINNIFSDMISDNDGICYKLKNGATVTRKYNTMFINLSDSTVYFSDDLLDGFESSIVMTKPYITKYSKFMNADISEFETALIHVNGTNEAESATEYTYRLKKIDDLDYEYNYLKKLIEAYRKDVEEEKEGWKTAVSSLDESNYSYGNVPMYVACMIEVEYDVRNMNSISNIISNSSDILLVPKGYTNTIEALKEMNILNSDGKPNAYSPYLTSNYALDYTE